MNTILYQSGKTRISYDVENSFLVVNQGAKEWVTLIGPVGLLEVGIELCQIARGNSTATEIYSHPDGVFHIEFLDQAVYFTEGDRNAVVSMSDEDLLDFGLTLIEYGHEQYMAMEDSYEPRCGNRVTFSDAEAAA